jgi:photosystem II stability/assembly factor-like uncharacterized protein
VRVRSGDIREDLFDLYCLPDGLHGWAVNGHAVYRTDDGWQTWEKVLLHDILGPLEGLEAVHFVDANEGWAVTGYTGSILHSLDGGRTWAADSVTNNWLEDVHFFDRLHGWILGTWLILRTEDGGASWSKYEAGILPLIASFVSPLRGWVSTWGGVYATTDGGASWARQDTVHVVSVAFADSLRGCAVAGGYGNPDLAWAEWTDDGGATWTHQTLGGHGLWDVGLNPDGTGHAVGRSGRILSTSDAGRTWIEETSGQLNHLVSVSVRPGATWAGGDFGTLLVEPGPAPGWNRLGALSGYFRDVACGDPLHAVAVGDWMIMRSADAGATWTECWPDYGYTIPDLNCVDMVGPDRAWASGYWLDGVLRSLDGGQTWTRFPLPVQGRVGGLDFADSLHGWCVLNSETNGLVCRTSDGGVTWVEQPAATSFGWGCVFALDSLHAWVGGSLPPWGAVARTLDGGLTWTPHTLPAPEDVESLVFRDAREGWATTSGGGAGSHHGTVFHTINGGVDWTAVHEVDGVWLDVALLGDGGVAVAGGRNEAGEDIALIDRQSGPLAPWVRDLEQPGTLVRALAFGSPYRGCAVGDWGDIFRWPVATDVLPDGRAPGPRLSLSVIGNPAQGDLLFDVSGAGAHGPASVRLDILDVRGALVRSLHAPVTGGGPVRLGWDGTTSRGAPASSGVFFVRARAGDRTATARFVRLR